MIEGLSINGLWPAGLPVAVAVVLLTILAVRVVGGRPKAARPKAHEDRSQRRDRPSDPGQPFEATNIRAELPTKTSHPTRGKDESRMLGRPASASGSASTMAALPQNHPTGW